MQIDEITRRRLKKYIDITWSEVINNPEQRVQECASAMYVGALKVIDILGIDIDTGKKADN